LTELPPHSLSFGFESVAAAADASPWPWDVGFPSLLVPIDADSNALNNINGNTATANTRTNSQRRQNQPFLFSEVDASLPAWGL
jgi:hypothetical protein